MEVVAGTLKLTSGDSLLEGPCGGSPGGDVPIVARTLKLTSGDPLLGGPCVGCSQVKTEGTLCWGGHVEVVARLKLPQGTLCWRPCKGCSHVKTDLRETSARGAMWRL